MAGCINIWVGNAGDYDAGTLRGDWVSLPLPEEKLEAFLREKVGVTSDYEYGYFIGDADPVPAGMYQVLRTGAGPCPDLRDVNLLAMEIECMGEWELAAVGAWMNAHGTHDILEALNVCLQSDDIPYHELDSSAGKTAQECYGELILENHPTLKQLLDDDYKIAHAFDVEAYGRMCAEEGDVVFLEDGYIETRDDPIDRKLFTREQLAEVIGEDYAGHLIERQFPHPSQLRKSKDKLGGDAFAHYGVNCKVTADCSPDGLWCVSSTLRDRMCPEEGFSCETFVTYGTSLEEAYRNNVSEIQESYGKSGFGELEIANPENPACPFKASTVSKEDLKIKPAQADEHLEAPNPAKVSEAGLDASIKPRNIR